MRSKPASSRPLAASAVSSRPSSPEPQGQARWNPHFLPGFIGGRRFVMQLEPPAGVAARGRILCVQPLSEEANLSRRVLVAMAAAMARQGWVVSIPDLFGMGDSDGECEDITLATWRADLDRLAREGATGPDAPRHDPP